MKLDLAGSVRSGRSKIVAMQPKAEPNHILLFHLLITEFGQNRSLVETNTKLEVRPDPRPDATSNMP